MNSCTPRAAWLNLLRRLHFYIGLFVGPFIFIAALSGTLYVATPQLENHLYKDALYGVSEGERQPLAQQITVAQQATGGRLSVQAVRPALSGNDTTRVMFADPQLNVSESRALFIDPVTLQVKGDMTVYGTSGILPLRQWIDYFHRSLLLGDIGRLYSELAASWMWVAALGGIVLWFYTRPKRRMHNRMQNTRRLHVTLGWGLLAGMLLFSATGLTWSQWAGGNVDRLRAAFGWMTPQVNTQLVGAPTAADPHAEHHMHHPAMMSPAMTLAPAQYDEALHSAQRAGIASLKVEIRPPRSMDKAWTVSEIDRRWPTRVDAVAIDGSTMRVIDQTHFKDFPLMAKLTRWGVDFHMGVLFGLPNQALLIAFGCALCIMIIIGYRLWWLRRPAVNASSTLMHCWLMLPLTGRVATVLVALLLGLALPVMGGSLLLFVLIDALRFRRQTARQSVSAV